MASKEALHPVGCALQHTDGTVQMYLRAAKEFNKYDMVKANANGNVVAYENNELRLPEGMAVEHVGKDEYSFFLIKGQLQEKKGKIKL